MIFSSSHKTVSSSDLKVLISADDSVLYFTAVKVSNNAASICKFTVSGTQSQCTSIGVMDNVDVILLLSSSKFFITGRDGTASKPIFLTFEWGNVTPIWQKHRTCQNSYWFVKPGVAIQSTDGSLIYSLIPMNYDLKVVFSIYSATDGAIVNSRYETDLGGIEFAFDIKLNNGKLHIYCKYSVTTLMLTFDTSTQEWTQAYTFLTPYGTFMQGNSGVL